MTEIEKMQFKYNEHVNNISTELDYVMKQNNFSKHNISKAKWEKCYKNNTQFHSVLLELDNEFFKASECDFNKYIEWLINGNKTR